MLPQSQLQNTPFCYLQHTWQLPTLLTPLSRSTSLPSGTCMCQQDYMHNLTANSLHAYNSSKRYSKKPGYIPPPRDRLSITLQIMQSINDLLINQPHSYANILIWAACCLAFFGFLRVSEFTIPSNTSYDKECHLSPADISIDDRNNPQLLKVKIKQSKTDPFWRGVDVYLGATGTTLCPIKAILPYLALRPNHHNGPLFIFEDGCSLTRQCFSSILDNLLSRLGFDTTQYNTHSFRIGAATTAAQSNIPHTSIQILGRWKSNAYQTYIKTPPQELARFSKYLASSCQ